MRLLVACQTRRSTRALCTVLKLHACHTYTTQRVEYQRHLQQPRSWPQRWPPFDMVPKTSTTLPQPMFDWLVSFQLQWVFSPRKCKVTALTIQFVDFLHGQREHDNHTFFAANDWTVDGVCCSDSNSCLETESRLSSSGGEDDSSRTVRAAEEPAFVDEGTPLVLNPSNL